MKSFAIIAISAVLSIYSAFCFMCLWNWFAVTIVSVPTIELAQAWGINLLASFASHQIPNRQQEEGSHMLEFQMAHSFVYTTVTLFVAFIIQLFL